MHIFHVACIRPKRKRHTIFYGTGATHDALLSFRNAKVGLDLVVVHRFDNDAPTKDVKTVFEYAYKGIGNAEFGPLLQLILDAEKEWNADRMAAVDFRENIGKSGKVNGCAFENKKI
jgi:hypothetical protein